MWAEEKHVEILLGADAGPEFSTLPLQLIERFVDVAMRKAQTKLLESTEWYAFVPRLPGVWATGADEAAALSELRGVIKDWVNLKIADGDKDIPELESINLNWL
ncbi:MAG: hypothetical protein WAM97_18500 [Acidimicrobiales bacterium]